MIEYPLPAAPVVREWARERADLAARQRQCHEALEGAQREAAQAAAALRALSEDLPAPRPEALAEARARRDVLFAAWESSGHSPEGREAYRTARTDADALADRLVEASERVARLAELRRSLADLEAARAARADAARDADREHAAWEARWRSFWEGTGVRPPDSDGGEVPGAPPATDITGADVEAMIAWREEVARLQESATEIARLEADRERLLKVLLPFEARLRAAFPDTPAAPLTELIARLEERANQTRENAAVRRTASERIASLDQEITSLEAEFAEAQAARDYLDLAAREYLALIGMPEVTSLDHASDLLAGLREVSLGKARWAERQEGLERDASDLAAFDRRVERLREALSEEAPPAPHAEFLAALAVRLREAREAQARREEREEQQRAALANYARAEEKRLALTSCVEAWLARAGVETEGELAAAAESAGRRAHLEGERDRARALLEAALLWQCVSPGEAARSDAPSTAGAAILDALQGQSLESLRDTHRRLGGELRKCRDRLADVQVAIGKCEHEMQQYGGGEAALRSARIEEVRAEMQEDAEEYVVHFFAERVLQSVVEQFARDNQPELLRTASSLMERITDGRFTGVRQSADEKTLMLVPAGGAEHRTPDRLSTGEREQMFLALRLAFVTRYCAAAEPLPVVLDDVLVNFDERRAGATLRALADVSATTQVLFFTCHRDLRDLARETVPGAIVTQLPVMP